LNWCRVQNNKECETDALDMCTRQRTIKFIEEYFFCLGNFLFLQSSIKTYFCVHCLFSSQENNSKQSVARKLKHDCFTCLGIEILWFYRSCTYLKDYSKGSTTNLIFSPFDNCSKTSVYLTMSLINHKLAETVYIYPSIRKKLKIIT